MLIHPQFDPIAFSIGPLGVHWYGLMYLLGFLAFWLLGRRRAQDYWRGVTPDDVENLLFWGVFGVVLGGRLGYCLFYQPAWYLTHPLQIFSVWQGGMSAHGGLLGVLIVMALYVRRHGMRFWQLTDFVAPLVPLGLFFRPHRELYQWRALGQASFAGPSVGHDFSSGAGRRYLSSSFPAL